MLWDGKDDECLVTDLVAAVQAFRNACTRGHSVAGDRFTKGLISGLLFIPTMQSLDATLHGTVTANQPLKWNFQPVVARVDSPSPDAVSKCHSSFDNDPTALGNAIGPGETSIARVS